MQAEFENDEARAEFRLALSEHRRTQVVWRNRRLNGEVFYNLLLLEPIKTDGGFGGLALGARFELTKEEMREVAPGQGHPVKSAVAAARDISLLFRLEKRRIAANSAVQLIRSWLTLKEL